jgi:hypothetical protein
MRLGVLIASCLSVCVLGVPPVVAGPYADDLSKCLVEQTSENDRTSLVRWMYVAATRHPAVQKISVVTDKQLDDANRQMADLMSRLLTESCLEATKKSVKYEGEQTIGTACELLGQVAATELLGHADVVSAMSSLQEYFDQEALDAALEPE